MNPSLSKSPQSAAFSLSAPTREAYAAIEYLYGYFNQVLFGGGLPDCLLTFQRQPRVMGYFSQKRWVNNQRYFVDELAINPEYFYGCPLEELCQTVVHEQCHVWQFHFGRPSRRSYHNREWADKMISLGLVPSATGEPGGAQVGQKMDDFIQQSGPLHVAIQQLIVSGFCLKWVDTAPVYTRPRKPKIYNAEGLKIDSPTRITGYVTDLPVMENVSEPDKPGQQMIQDVNPVPNLPVDIRVAEPEVALLSLPESIKKPQTRVKYQCACPRPNLVWGRANLNIACRDCGQDFVLAS